MSTSSAAGYSIINTSPVRKDVPAKSTGQAKYTADLTLPNMLTGAILHSHLAHARILNIDVTRAAKVKGVKAVLTAKDITGAKFGHSPARYDEKVLAADRVRYVGDEVAAIAAVDEQTAREALELIRVDYEMMPVILDPLQSLKDNATLIHEEYPGNICQEVHNTAGNIVKGFAQSHIVRTDRFMNKKTEGVPLEPQACLASFDISGSLTLWTSTQVTHYVQRAVSRMLQLPMDRVRVIAPCVGGGFGVKASAGSHELITCLLSLKTGQPVKLVLDREQVFLRSRGRHQYYHQMTIGVDREGKIQAHEHISVLDGGAYSSFGIATIYYNGSLLHGPYWIPNIKYDGYRVFTNKPACGALRGHGGLSNRACFETQLDIVAGELGMDPIEIRIKNALHAGSTTKSGYFMSSFNVAECLQSARDESEWQQKKGKLPPGKGIGVASSYFVSGAGGAIYHTDIPHSTVIIRVAEDGNGVTVFTGSNEIGQGSDTVMAMIAAEVLGLPLENVSVISGDTGLCPIDLGAYSSRQTLMTGNATKQAAEAIKEQILEALSRQFDMPASTFKLAYGKIEGTEKNQKKLAQFRDNYRQDHRHFAGLPLEGPLTFAEFTHWLYARKGTITGKGTYRPSDLQYSKEWKGSVVGASPAYSTQTCIAEVSVDMDTGQISIDKLTLAHDCGFAINRQAVEGQLEGSMCQGLGECLFEEVIFDDKGKVVNASYSDYKIPTSMDVPDIKGIIIESHEPNGPFGAKEVGEGSILPIIPAIINAIHDACGIVIMELPVTSEKVLKALQSKQESGQEIYIYKPPAIADAIIERALELLSKQPD
jgi:4-hydroxybenzoyl-CoA reductase alpha subunit